MSNKKKAKGKPSKPALVHLSATPQQMDLLLASSQALDAAVAQFQREWRSFLAAHGRTSAQLVEFRPGENPQVIVQEAENTGQTQPSRSRS